MFSRLLFGALALSMTAIAAPWKHFPNGTSSGSNGTMVVGNVPLPEGYSTILFADDFSSGSKLSSDRWIVDTGTAYPNGPARWGTNEVQTYTSAKSNLRVEENTLVITPLWDNYGFWTSARIETTKTFACPPGSRLRFEARLRLGATPPERQLGIWPAFWALGAGLRKNPHSWPSVGEVDILESANGLSTTYQTIHCGDVVAGGPCREMTGIGREAAITRGEWHVVAVEIDRRGEETNERSEGKSEEKSGRGKGKSGRGKGKSERGKGKSGRGKKETERSEEKKSEDKKRAEGEEKENKKETITWLVDGIQTNQVTPETVAYDEAAWAALAHNAHFLLLNVAVGGALPDSVAGMTTPNEATEGGAGAAMEVAYVGVFGM